MRAKPLRVLLLTSALALAATTAQAGWLDVASPRDAQRLGQLQESKEKGMQEAAAGPDMAVIHAVLDPASQRTSDGEARGAWRCRTIKLGGMTPSVVYSWFTCRIADRGGHLYFEKISGSQRVSGWLYPDQSGGLVLLGANTVNGEPQRRYSGSGASAGADATPDDAVGVLTAIGSGHARIEFPYPVQESTFDVIELKR
jgi:hypothetical protein